MVSILVGTCGFPTARSRYYELFPVVELQETFYDLPTEDRMRHLREEAPSGFAFTVKVFQGLTHGVNSPTWRRARRARLTGNTTNYGLLKPTRENLELWGEFLRLTKPLNPALYIFQTPPSMVINSDIAKDVVEFFRSIGEPGRVGWEPRGASYSDPNSLMRVFNSTDVIHVVDPFRRSPMVTREVAYFRLHGIGEGEVNYRYRYSDSDLDSLRRLILGQVSRVVYVMFNNVHMLDDALRFKRLIETKG